VSENWQERAIRAEAALSFEIDRMLAFASDAAELGAQVAKVRALVGNLDLIAQQLRSQGDVRQVVLSEDGINDGPTLADELWLLAYTMRAALGSVGEGKVKD
jgi:hypothetical protein